MSDAYLNFVSGGFGKKLAKQLGLPSPARLRRHTPGDPLVDGPVLVLSDDDSRPDADALAAALLPFVPDVRRTTHLPDEMRWAAVIVVLTQLTTPAASTAVALELGSTLRRLAPSGRIVTVSRVEDTAPSAAAAAARAGVQGLVRSLAKELRAGATANGVLLADDVGVADPTPLAALRFLLSGRSAFVAGQMLRIDAAGADDATPERPLGGRVAVVTGAARGIGAEIVRTLARDGAHVVGVDVPSTGDALAKVMNEVRGAALQLDVTAEDAAERIMQVARDRFGGLDIVVHNAGILRDKLLANMTEDRWASLMAVNIEAPLRITDRLLEAARAGEIAGPRIISLASTSGIAGNRGQTNYAAAKAGIIGMTERLADDAAAVGGTINAVAPGFIETEMTAKIPPVMRQVARRMNSLQQGGLPVDVAEAISFLASEGALGINGQTLRVCGQHIVGR